MNPGRLNKRIQFVTTGEVEDDYGFPVESEVVMKSVWGSIKGLRGKEYYNANQVQAQDNKVVNCRYFKGLEKDWFIKYNDKLYNIKSINNINEANVEYEIHASEVSSSE